MRELFLLFVLQRVVVPVCVVLCGSWSCGCRAWILYGSYLGGNRSTKPCFFPCKTAAATEERYLVCAADAAGVSSCANCSSYLFCNEWLYLCAYFYAVLESLVAWSHWNSCMNVAWVLFWEGSRSMKPCVFRAKCLHVAKKGTSSVRRMRLSSFHCLFYVFATSGCSCVHSSMGF